ncbi:MAG: MBL fold hydrolase [Candidatus Brocadia sp. WS118]|nr:MAG: MBL fold hydrolase [Candidatus Brocadia sp. WS118]
MQYEIDFLPVGDGEKGGDAIAFRFSRDEGRSWFVGVVDGGTKDSGEALCQHIDKYYKTSTINVVVNSHPDGDHASGLTEVIDHFKVDLILMHRSWEHVDEIYQYVQDGRVTKQSLKDRLKEHLPFAWEIEKLAGDKRIPLIEPFSDQVSSLSSNIYILNPSRDFYLQQLIRFRPIAEFTQGAEFRVRQLLETVKKAAQATTRWVAESWDKENLIDPADDATSYENNSSTVLLLNFENQLHLLTADAGVPALRQAALRAMVLGFHLRNFNFVQIPHHGSKRNVGPTILNQLIGEPVSEGQQSRFTAFVSIPKAGAPKHPSRRVLNAFTRRGAKVISTDGNPKLHYHQTPDRPEWISATPQPFYSQVEEDD